MHMSLFSAVQGHCLRLDVSTLDRVPNQLMAESVN